MSIQVDLASVSLYRYLSMLLHRLELSGEDGYVLDGVVRQFETHTETIRVLQSDGSHTEEALNIRRSVHGPVVRMNLSSTMFARLDSRFNAGSRA